MATSQIFGFAILGCLLAALYRFNRRKSRKSLVTKFPALSLLTSTVFDPRLGEFATSGFGIRGQFWTVDFDLVLLISQSADLT